jgi:hypothetical protein
VSWRTAGIGLTSLAAPVRIGLVQPVFGEVIAEIEIAVMLTIIGTALFGRRRAEMAAWLRSAINAGRPYGTNNRRSGRQAAVRIGLFLRA